MYFDCPQRLEEIKSVESVSASSAYSYAISKVSEADQKEEEIPQEEQKEGETKVENQVFSWGFGANYILGTKEEDNKYTPYAVDNDNQFKNFKVHQIACGMQHVVALVTEAGKDLPEI